MKTFTVYLSETDKFKRIKIEKIIKEVDINIEIKNKVVSSTIVKFYAINCTYNENFIEIHAIMELYNISLKGFINGIIK